MPLQNPDNSSRVRRAQETSTRRSAVRAVIFLVLAVVAAAAAATILSRSFDERLQVIKESQVETQPVVVAAVDIPLGTTLDEELLKTVDWPVDAAPESAFASVDELIDRVVITKMFSGEPMLALKLADPGAGSGLAAILPPGLLAVAIRVDDVVGVAGFIHPGDRVDVIVTMKPDSRSDSQPTSKIILQNITVLTVGGQINRAEQKRAKPMPTTVATLMVTPEQAEGIALAATQGEILLALRSALTDEMFETGGMVATELIPGTRIRRALGRRRPVAKPPTPTPTPTPAPGEVVEILRGDRFEKRRFEGKDQAKKESE